MASDENKLSVLLGLDLGNLPGGMAAAVGTVETGTAAMSTAFAGLGAAVHAAMAPITAILAIVGGGSLFKHAVDSAQEWTLSTAKLARALGTTTEAASAYKVALHGLGIDSDLVARAATMMGRQVASGGEGLRRLGINVRDDVTGQFKPAVQLMEEANAKIRAIGDQATQNIAGQLAYGRAWGEVRQIVTLTKDQLAEAKERAEKLGLVVGGDGVAKARAYKREVNELKLVFEALSINIGNALIPSLTELARSFNSMGTNVFQPIMAMAEGAIWAFDTLGVALRIPNAMMVLLGKSMWAALKAALALALTLAGIVSGDWGMAKELWNNGFLESLKETRDELKGEADKIEEMFANYAKRTKGHFDRANGIKPPPLPEPAPPPKSNLDLRSDAEKMKAWELELSRLKAANLLKWTVSDERAYWTGKLAATMQGSELNHSLQIRVNELAVQAHKEGFEAQLSALKRFQQLYKDDADAHLQYQIEITDLTLKEYKRESPQAQAALDDLYAAVLKHQERISKSQSESLKQLQEYEGKRSDLMAEEVRSAAGMGLLSPGQEVEALIAIEEEKYRVHQDYSAQLLNLEGLTNDERVAIVGRATEEMNRHDAEMGKLSAQRMKLRVEEIKGYINPLVDSVASVFEGLLNGTIAMADALKRLFDGLKNAVIKMVIDIAANWVKQQLLMLIAGKATGVAQVAQEKAIAASRIAGNVSGTISDAGLAGAEAAKAVAGIPVIGPGLAPVAMAEVSGAILSAMVPLASASGGFDIGNFAPLTQLHPREMVLPANLADRVRSMTDSGAAGGGQTNVAINVHGAIDGQSVYRVLTDNSAHVVRAISEMRRNGRL